MLSCGADYDCVSPRSSYASGAPDAYEASANAVSEKYIGKTVPGACRNFEHDNSVFAKGYGFADLENNTAIDRETTVLNGVPYQRPLCGSA